MNLLDLVIYTVIGVAGLIALWLPVMLIAALFSGWWELAKDHPRRPPETGARRGAGSVYLSPLFRYKGIVTYAADDEHLHLSMPPILGAFHPPISIPWAALHFFKGENPVLGMIAAEIDGRRMLLSRHMVKHELAVRRAMQAMGETPPHAEPASKPDPPKEPSHATHEDAQ